MTPIYFLRPDAYAEVRCIPIFVKKLSSVCPQKQHRQCGKIDDITAIHAGEHCLIFAIQ